MRVVIEVRCATCEGLLAEVSVEDLTHSNAIAIGPHCGTKPSIILCPIVQDEDEREDLTHYNAERDDQRS